MFVALDSRGNRIYADSPEKYSECFCLACNSPVKHKKGKIRRPYFAHEPNSNCHFGLEKDYKSEWHIRLQEYFPKEAREVRFIDKETGQVHIADVYIKESNSVLEFQHSPISEDEFMSRTSFHMKNGRRVVWLFDESAGNAEGQNYGRFKSLYEEHIGVSLHDILYEPYDRRKYKWMRRPRKFLCKGPDIGEYADSYCICVYTGTEGDLFHRIVGEEFGFEEVVFSIHNIEMNSRINVDEFFYSEIYWQSHEPWKAEFEQRNASYAYVLNEREKAKRQQMSMIQNSILMKSKHRRNWRF